MSIRFLSIQQISEVSGKDRRTIKKRLAHLQVHAVVGKAKLYDMHAAYDAIADPIGPDNVEIAKQMRAESLRHEIARADKLELEVGKMKQEYIAIEEIAEVVEREYGAVRAGFLAMPSKLMADLAEISNPIKIKNRLEDAVNEVLGELVADKSYKELRNGADLPEKTIPETPKDK